MRALRIKKTMTIGDIARLARVSTSTVSRVINNECAGEKTRQIVLRIIKKYEYYPNSYAQYLGRKKAKFSVKTGSGTIINRLSPLKTHE